VWLLEDVHWIDTASAELVHYLARRLAGEPFLLVTTVRTYTDLGSAASKLLDGLATLDKAIEIELDGLSVDETAELVAMLGGDAGESAVTRIHRLSGGNPFLIAELVRATSSLDDSNPAVTTDRSNRLFTADIRSLLSRRMHGLAPGAVRVLEVVAAAGREARPGIVAEAAGVRPEKLTDLARALYERGLLRDIDGKLEFAHEITREFVYSNLGDLQRAALHLALGEVLARSGHDVDPATLARHFQLGGDRPRAFEHAIEAAEAAGDRHAHKEAADLARLALGQTRSDSQKATALELLARAQLSSGHLGNAQSRLEDLIDLGQLSAMETAAIRLDLARARLELASWEEALEQIEEVETALGNPSDTQQLELLLQALHMKLKVAIRRNQPSRAKGVIRRIERRRNSSTTRDRTDTVNLLLDGSQLAYSLFYGDPLDKVKWSQTLDRYQATGSPDLRLKSLILAGVAAARGAQWDRAEHYFTEGLGKASEHRDVILTVSMLNNLACCALEQGNWDTAEHLFERINAATSSLPQRLYVKIGPEINRGTYYFYTEQPSKALAIFNPLLDLVEGSGIGASTPDLHACMGLIALQQGRENRAQTHYEAVASVSDDHLQAVQDRFKILWLNGYMRFREKPHAAIRYLREAADRDARTDVVSAAKSQWLASLLSAGSMDDFTLADGDESDSVQTLQAHGLKWFAYFSRRWLRRAEQVLC
jgi:tetratricopeptide (TPR) repeat protein